MKNRFSIVFAATLLFLLFGVGSVVAASSGTFSGWTPVNSQNASVFEVASQSLATSVSQVGFVANESLGLSLVLSAVLSNIDLNIMATEVVAPEYQLPVGNEKLEVPVRDPDIFLDGAKGRVTTPDGDLISIGPIMDPASRYTNPEPGSVILLGTGLIGVGLAGYRRYKNQKQQ